MAADYILGLDYGAERVGVGIAHSIARLPRPLVTLKNDETLFDQLAHIVQSESVGRIVVGVPRNMDGSLSSQSVACEDFAAVLRKTFNQPVVTTDETLSSVEAEQRLKGAHLADKSLVDAQAAAIILERYFEQDSGESV
jgi:putative Holliday junction resolvase